MLSPSPAWEGGGSGGGAALELEVEGAAPTEHLPCAFYGQVRKGWEWGCWTPSQVGKLRLREGVWLS